MRFCSDRFFLYFWFSVTIFQDFKYLWIVSIIVFWWFLNQYLLQYVYKNEKLSVLLPYDSLDKIFIVIIWFALFYWTNQGTSVITLLITLLTIGIIIVSTIDIRQISLPKTVLIFILHKIIKSFLVLGIWFFLLKYSSIDYLISDWVLYLFFSLIAVILLKKPFINLFNQSRKFYINRYISTLFLRVAHALSLYIIQDSGVIIATLLWFFYITFSIFSMKFIALEFFLWFQKLCLIKFD